MSLNIIQDKTCGLWTDGRSESQRSKNSYDTDMTQRSHYALMYSTGNYTPSERMPSEYPLTGSQQYQLCPGNCIRCRGTLEWHAMATAWQRGYREVINERMWLTVRQNWASEYWALHCWTSTMSRRSPSRVKETNRMAGILMLIHRTIYLEQSPWLWLTELKKTW